MGEPQEDDIALLPRPPPEGVLVCRGLLRLLDGEEQQLEVPGLDVEEADNDLFAPDLAEGVEDLADGKLDGDQQLGAGRERLAAVARLQVLEERLGEEGNPLGQIRIQQLGKFLEGVQKL